LPPGAVAVYRDTTAPTAPTNLTVTARTTSSVSLSWTAAKDNVSVAGYWLFRNGAAVGKTRSTSAKFGKLACGTDYKLGVAAYDAAGNRSATTSLTANTSACPDTAAPTAPADFAVTGSGPDSVSLAWSPSVDAVGVAGYDVYANGARVGTTEATSDTVDALSCLTSYTFEVVAFDAAGNRSPGSSLGATTGECTQSVPQTASSYPVRGVYDRDFSSTGFDDEQALGFNFIDSGPYTDQLDPLASLGLRGFVWLGGYSNDTCTFNETDEWVSSHVAAIAGNPGVGAYFIDDEPDAARCPSAPAQMKARSELVKSLDPGPPTFLVSYKVDQFKLFAGTVDVLGLDHYPCSIKNGCDYSKIDAEAAEADRLGIRYWGVIQAYGDDWYKVPTPEELHQEFVHWRATNMEGYLVFAWRYPDDMPANWLANHPELQSQLALENAN
jgi:chitodextrinase